MVRHQAKVFLNKKFSVWFIITGFYLLAFVGIARCGDTFYTYPVFLAHGKKRISAFFYLT
jgi:hypothetical protein